MPKPMPNLPTQPGRSMKAAKDYFLWHVAFETMLKKKTLLLLKVFGRASFRIFELYLNIFWTLTVACSPYQTLRANNCK